MTARLRVVIAEDHYLVREGTRQLLEGTGEVTVVDAVADADALLKAVDRLKPDAIVVDIRLPPGHTTEGLEASRSIRARFPEIGIVVMSQYANALYALDLFRDGTEGLAYLLKDRIGDVGELIRAVRAVIGGGSVIDPLVVEGLMVRRDGSRDRRLSTLTEREHQVLAEMAQGKSNTAIAESLFVSESAVEKHISTLMAKLALEPDDAGLNRRVAAVLAYLRAGTGAGVDEKAGAATPHLDRTILTVELITARPEPDDR